MHSKRWGRCVAGRASCQTSSNQGSVSLLGRHLAVDGDACGCDNDKAVRRGLDVEYISYIPVTDLIVNITTSTPGSI
jgi:hypothetical protein